MNDMVRMGQQLNSASQQGSLMKPLQIKQDKEDRLKQKRNSGSMGIIMSENSYYLSQHSKKEIEKQEEPLEEIEEYKLELGARNKKYQK